MRYLALTLILLLHWDTVQATKCITVKYQEPENNDKICNSDMKTENWCDEGVDCPSASISLAATCDDNMRIFFDGVLKHQDEDWGTSTGQWTRATKLEIPKGTKVLGIKCFDFAGSNGIRASTSSGSFATDDSWMCSSNENLEGWAVPGFQDTNGDFSPASTTGNTLQGSTIEGISSDSKWIWAADSTPRYAACKIDLCSISKGLSTGRKKRSYKFNYCPTCTSTLMYPGFAICRNDLPYPSRETGYKKNFLNENPHCCFNGVSFMNSWVRVWCAETPGIGYDYLSGEEAETLTQLASKSSNASPECCHPDTETVTPGSCASQSGSNSVGRKKGNFCSCNVNLVNISYCRKVCGKISKKLTWAYLDDNPVCCLHPVCRRNGWVKTRCNKITG